MTEGLPPVAMSILEIGTVSGKRPTVVEGPYDRTTPRFKEVEKQRIVEIIAVDVVEVYYIRIVVADI